MGFEAIIRNEKGGVMASFSVIGPSVADTEEAELLQCRKALEFAVDMRFTDIMVEGDNSVVIKVILSS